MENTQKTDVLIIGAGPTGLTMATQLIRYDIDFISINKRHESESGGSLSNRCIRKRS